METNYIVSSYVGERRPISESFEQDPSYLLKTLLFSLGQIPHNLSQITIVSNRAPAASQNHIEYLASVNGTTVGGAQVVVIERENIGISYGAWADTIKRYGTQFDYSIVVEDDYIPTLPNFDTELIRILEAKEHCGYLCSYAIDWIDNIVHACVSNGIIKTEAAMDIVEKDGAIMYANGRGNDFGKSNQPGQVLFSRSFTNNGWDIADYGEKYFAPYVWLTYIPYNGWEGGKEPIFVPVTLLGQL